MDKPSKLNERLTLIANIAVVLGIVFLALEMRQNTDMMRAQIRDSMTEKQMEYYGWVATNPAFADVFVRGNRGDVEEMGEAERMMFNFGFMGILREYENSYYQYQEGLFSPEEFEVRLESWRTGFRNLGWQQMWALRRQQFSADFRAEIDAIVAEIEN